MGDIGKIMEESGFEDIDMRSNLYRSSEVQVIKKGKTYNRGVRTHKLMNESMNRLKWKSFQKWLEVNEIEVTEEEKEAIANNVRTLRGLLQSNPDTSDSNEVKAAVNAIREHSARINHLMHDFSSEGCSLS